MTRSFSQDERLQIAASANNGSDFNMDLNGRGDGTVSTVGCMSTAKKPVSARRLFISHQKGRQNIQSVDMGHDDFPRWTMKRGVTQQKWHTNGFIPWLLFQT
jgi:hypothetical protein